MDVEEVKLNYIYKFIYSTLKYNNKLTPESWVGAWFHASLDTLIVLVGNLSDIK